MYGDMEQYASHGPGRADRQTKESSLISHMKVSAAVGSNANALYRIDSPYNSHASAAAKPSGSASASASPNPHVAPGSSAAHEVNENLRRALRISESTNATGYATMQGLGKQRETIQNSLHTVDTTHQNLQESQQVIRGIRFQVYKEWLIKGCVIGSLCLLIVFIFYVKFIRKR